MNAVRRPWILCAIRKVGRTKLCYTNHNKGPPRTEQGPGPPKNPTRPDPSDPHPQVTLDLLPTPTSNASTLIEKLATNQKLDATDLVALSGGHACIHWLSEKHCNIRPMAIHNSFIFGLYDRPSLGLVTLVLLSLNWETLFISRSNALHNALPWLL